MSRWKNSVRSRDPQKLFLTAEDNMKFFLHIFQKMNLKTLNTQLNLYRSVLETKRNNITQKKMMYIRNSVSSDI